MKFIRPIIINSNDFFCQRCYSIVQLVHPKIIYADLSEPILYSIEIIELFLQVDSS